MFNINNKKCFLSIEFLKIHVTGEDWSNYAENSALTSQEYITF